jgi:hypothetical protein
MFQPFPAAVSVLQDGHMAGNKTPTHTAYTLKRQGCTASWLEIGVAMMHSDGQGYGVLLDRVQIHVQRTRDRLARRNSLFRRAE